MNNRQEQTMGSAAVNQITIWEQKYYDITELYALNEELLATVEKATDPEAQLALIAALVETMWARCRAHRTTIR